MKIQNKTFTLLFLLIAVCFIAAPNLITAKTIEETIKDSIDKLSDTLKNAVEEIGDDIEGIQRYLDHYHFRGIVEEKATSGPATLKHIKLNGHRRAVAVRPGERIEASVKCSYDSEACSALSYYRVVVGMKGLGPQTTTGNHLGVTAGESHEKFVLIAPSNPGLYQIRFRTVEALLESTAFQAWTDEKGNEPDGTTTIGLIFVK